MPATAVRWIAFGGVCGAIAVSSQWLSFDLTTIAIAITVQQMSVLFVMALVPIMFRQPFERMNPRFFGGAILVLMGAIIGCTVLVLRSVAKTFPMAGGPEQGCANPAWS